MILGIGGFLHSAACAFIRDGVLTAAVEQKKIARQERPGQLPLEAIAEVLRLSNAGGDHARVQCVAIARPFPAGSETLLHVTLRGMFPDSRLVVVEHHEAHAASAYYASPFEHATVLTLDRLGDFRCGARWRGEGNRLTVERELFYPDSLGDLYGRVTELLGFNRNADEHKVQWLSTAGDRSYAGLFEEILGIANGADWPRIHASWFDGRRLSRGGFSAKFYDSLGLKDEAEIPERMRAQVAAGVQAAVESAVSRMAGDAPRLCLAGGLAYNALLVAALERRHEVFVQPASGNIGTAIGAAMYAAHTVLGCSARTPLHDLCLGPAYTAEEVKMVLENCKLRFRYLLTTEELIETAVREINDQKIVAWMQGRMEFGPRALGNRSILASPLNPYSTENLNVYIKHREPFRKFAASVPAELAQEYFDVGPNGRFLATVGRVRPAHRKTFDSAVLGDGLVRVHTVHRQDNPLYHRLLLAGGEKTGLPVLYNTSFNLFNDPLVCSPRDAVRSFYSSGIDALFAGNFFVEK
ncbi:MAG TPA: carbamoyltransferase C-terminal domain-containing protein [Bryobacteraceae bacterium]|nr:carbamoyltransferase C-terminal domain-containing protein [Bryobacteraceae bacterium]